MPHVRVRTPLLGDRVQTALRPAAHTTQRMCTCKRASYPRGDPRGCVGHTDESSERVERVDGDEGAVGTRDERGPEWTVQA
eukprot:1180755-Prorocentrum_minimum.AAC.2